MNVTDLGHVLDVTCTTLGPASRAASAQSTTRLNSTDKGWIEKVYSCVFFKGHIMTIELFARCFWSDRTRTLTKPLHALLSGARTGMASNACFSRADSASVHRDGKTR
jgi:hypothetical protein